MIFSYNWLQNYIKGKLPKPEKLAEFLTMHSFEVEDVKKAAGKDWVLDIDVLPNRAHDCLSHIGLAREISAITNRGLNIPKKEKLKISKSKLAPINLIIKAPSLVPRYSAIVIEGIRVGKSPSWLKEKIEVVGIKSINNIVDLTNYVMLETGQPLHAFDYDKIKQKQLILRMARVREKITTLDGVSHLLPEGTIVITDQERLIDLVGIMGGKLSEIDSGTKNIILQAGNFNRRTIYQTTKKMKFSTQASSIYAQGIDPNLTISSLERAYFLLRKLGGGKIFQIIDKYPKKTLAKKIKLDLDYIKSLLGVKIPPKEIKSILKRLNFGVLEKGKGKLIVQVPIFRLDVSIPEDLIEEIGRIYGYEKIPAEFPMASIIPPKRNEEIFWEDIAKNILKEVGFSEVYNYSFISEKQTLNFKFQEPKLIELENPLSSEQKYLRPSLIPGLLKDIEKNQKHFKEIKIFELGKIYRKFKKIEEKRMISGVIRGDKFYLMKGIIDLLLKKLGMSNIWYDSYKATPEESRIDIWNRQKSAEIKVDGEEIGFLGEISSTILKTLKVEGKVTAFNINFEKLSKLASEEQEYQPISKFPAAVRDLAILVPRKVLVADVLNKINSAGGVLVRDVDLFDIYEGEELPGSKKNLAFHIVYQAEDRTLSSKEIDNVHQKIIKFLEKDPQWEVRK